MARPKSSRSNAASCPVMPGFVLADKYVVEREIGEGGMAFVVAARHRELDELVAIKFLKPGQQNEELVRRFAREAKAMAKLKSQYITRIYDVGMSLEHGPYIVMELLHGENLGMVLHRLGALPERTTVDIILQAAMALAEAHTRGIVHRDVKPENIFLHAPDGNLERATVKLVDFGVSKAYLTGVTFGTSVELSRTTTLVGSPLYMAPEQIRARQDIDHRADIWALGVVLYELLTNESPFLAASIPELSARILEAEPTPLLELRPEASPELQEILERCLRKEPGDRYQSMAELAEALSPHASPPYAHLAASFPTGVVSTDPLALSQSGARAIDKTPVGPLSMRNTQRSTGGSRPGGPSSHGGSSRPGVSSQASHESHESHASHASHGGQSSKGMVVAVGLALLALVGVGVLLLRPAPAPASAPGGALVVTEATVELRTEPPGAAVEVDREARGATPLKTRLKPGSHTITFSLAGHESASLVVPVPSIGEVPPLPVVELKTTGAARPENQEKPEKPESQEKPENPQKSKKGVAEPPPSRPPAAPPTVAPSTTTPNRPRVIEDKPHVKVID